MAARTVGVDTKSVPVRDPNHFGSAFEDARGVDALMQMDDPLFTTHRRQLAELAVRSRLPAISGLRENADGGGLMSYGADYSDLYRRAATYIDKILKGAKPADIPVGGASGSSSYCCRLRAKKPRHFGRGYGTRAMSRDVMWSLNGDRPTATTLGSPSWRPIAIQ